METQARAEALTPFLASPPPTSRQAELLSHAVRKQIYEDIRAHPGESYMDIKRNLSLSNGGLTHHLRVLEREGLIHSDTEGGRRLLHSPDALHPFAGENARHRIHDGLLGAFAEAAGAAVSEVAGRLGISRQLATYHARVLAQQGLVRLERRGNRLFAVAGGAPQAGATRPPEGRSRSRLRRRWDAFPSADDRTAGEKERYGPARGH